MNANGEQKKCSALLALALLLFVAAIYAVSFLKLPLWLPVLG